jgi:cell division protease FtsH
MKIALRDNPDLSGFGGYGGERPFSEEIAKRIDSEIQKIIDVSHKEARRLLTSHRKELDTLAAAPETVSQ